MWAGRHNYELNQATVLRDLYRLASAALGDDAMMAASRSRGKDDPLYQLRERFLEDELVHLLIGTAVANRIQFEHMSGLRSDPTELSFERVEHSCGELQPDVEKDARVPLTFHDACHKIIHALNIVAQTPGEPEETPMRPEVTLHGKKRHGKSGEYTWVAHLNVTEYIRASVKNFGGGA